MADLLSRPEICQRFGISRWTWDRWVAAGIAPAPVIHAPGHHARWNRRDVELVPIGAFRGNGKRAYFTKARLHRGMNEVCNTAGLSVQSESRTR